MKTVKLLVPRVNQLSAGIKPGKYPYDSLRVRTIKGADGKESMTLAPLLPNGKEVGTISPQGLAYAQTEDGKRIGSLIPESKSVGQLEIPTEAGVLTATAVTAEDALPRMQNTTSPGGIRLRDRLESLVKSNKGYEPSGLVELKFSFTSDQVSFTEA